MNININNPVTRLILNHIQHYNHDKYWEMREQVINPNSKLPKIIRLWYLLRIKRADAFHNATMGTDLGKGAVFDSPPHFYHGMYGIIIGHDSHIGHNCTILQHATVESATVGDNCFVGAGAVILGKVTIGNNVKIGANAVVLTDLPDNCTAVGVPAKIIP